jgi:hypothetical protein
VFHLAHVATQNAMLAAHKIDVLWSLWCHAIIMRLQSRVEREEVAMLKFLLEAAAVLLTTAVSACNLSLSCNCIFGSVMHMQTLTPALAYV